MENRGIPQTALRRALAWIAVAGLLRYYMSRPRLKLFIDFAERSAAVIRLGTAAILLGIITTMPARADEKDEFKKLNGTWKPTAAELAGKKFPDEQVKAMKLVMVDDRYTVTVGEQLDKGTVKLDLKAKPKAMDITGTDGPNKGKTYPAIYELSGDTLKVCYALEGKERPTEFKTQTGTALFLVTYQRAKP